MGTQLKTSPTESDTEGVIKKQKRKYHNINNISRWNMDSVRTIQPMRILGRSISMKQELHGPSGGAFRKRGLRRTI